MLCFLPHRHIVLHIENIVFSVLYVMFSMCKTMCLCGKKPYCSLNRTGSVNRTFTAWPLASPGIQRGMFLTTRSASLPQPPPMSFMILMSLMLPSLPTTKPSTTTPSILASLANVGNKKKRHRPGVNAAFEKAVKYAAVNPDGNAPEV